VPGALIWIVEAVVVAVCIKRRVGELYAIWVGTAVAVNGLGLVLEDASPGKKRRKAEQAGPK
jgi:hypothetical protein